MTGFPDPQDALDAAARRALDDPSLAAEPAPVPFGRGLIVDQLAQRFVRSGERPAAATRTETLRNWCLVVAQSAAGAHRSLPPDVGVDRPEGPIGTADRRDDAVSDWAVSVRDAWLAHDRITSVDVDEIQHAGDRSDVFFVVMHDGGERLDLVVAAPS